MQRQRDFAITYTLHGTIDHLPISTGDSAFDGCLCHGCATFSDDPCTRLPQAADKSEIDHILSELENE